MSTTDVLSITLSLGWRTTPVSPGLWRSALKTLQNDPTVPNLQPLFADVLLAAVLVGINDQHAAPTLKGSLRSLLSWGWPLAAYNLDKRHDP